MKKVGKILLVIAVGMAVVCFGIYLYYIILTHGVRLDENKLSETGNCVCLYGADDQLVLTCGQNGKKTVSLDDLSKETVGAFLCAEDKTFFRHNGLNYKRMAGALWKNITSLSFKEGASTISQQLIKNTHLTQEKTISRKLKEIRLTKQLERRYSKREILEKYLNTIYFGHNAFGLASACEFYFGKTADCLTADEAAALAGMVRSPNHYSPFRFPEKCLNRRNFILGVMQKEGYISLQEEKTAKEKALPKRNDGDRERESDYVREVFDEIADKMGENVYDGIKIYTYLDVGLQQKLEEESENASQEKSMIVIDGKSGGIKAFLSDIGQAKRSPGSTIKPSLVYAPALEENYISPATPIADEKTNFNGYEPKNYDAKYHGYVSAREALAKSYNIPAVRLFNTLGIDRCEKYLRRCGITLSEKDKSLALALGGMEHGLSLRQICQTYIPFVRNGYYLPPAFVRKITDGKGKILYEQTTYENKVYSEDTVFLLNDMLKTACKSGTAKKLKNIPYDVCAKTGTNGDNRGNYDAYCIAYTSRDIVGVWLGSADNTADPSLSGGGLPTNINKNIQEYLYKNNTPQAFCKPNGVREYVLDKNSYETDHRLLLCDDLAPLAEKTYKEWFKIENRPRQVSTKYSNPKIKKVDFEIERGGIVLTFEYDAGLNILINRECNGITQTVYQGKCPDRWLDENLTEGNVYEYSITPFYSNSVGKTVVYTPIFYTIKRS